MTTNNQIAAWRAFSSDDLNNIMADTAAAVGMENFERKIDTFLAVHASGRSDIAVPHVLTFIKKMDALARTLPLEQKGAFLLKVMPLISVYGSYAPAYAA